MSKHSCVIKLSDEDLAYLIPDKPVEDAFRQLCEKTSSKLVILTKGAGGAVVWTPRHMFEVKAAVADPFVDAVGAGDTFMGTVLVELYKRRLAVHDIALLSLKNLQAMADRATRAAALNCESAGCNPPYKNCI
tara:strand:- start:102 stop:500 length:399 start_codon:yes stop_codon:yes gene_type:complete